jgi:hypothetical protein
MYGVNYRGVRNGSFARSNALKAVFDALKGDFVKVDFV